MTTVIDVQSIEVLHKSPRATGGMLKLAKAIEKSTDEVEGLRNEISQLGDTVARRRRLPSFPNNEPPSGEGWRGIFCVFQTPAYKKLGGG